jgi:hypothetical protein
VTDALLAATAAATLTPQATPYVGDGILVAMPEHGIVLAPEAEQVYGRVHDWVEQAAHHVTAPGATPARYFGAWRDEDGVLYLDVVQAFSSAEEDRALWAAFRRGQIAIWHNGRRELINTLTREPISH